MYESEHEIENSHNCFLNANTRFHGALEKNAFVIFHQNVITCLQPSFLANITKAPVIKSLFTILSNRIVPYPTFFASFTSITWVANAFLRMILSIRISSFNFLSHHSYIHKCTPPLCRGHIHLIFEFLFMLSKHVSGAGLHSCQPWVWDLVLRSRQDGERQVFQAGLSSKEEELRAGYLPCLRGRYNLG